MAVLITLILTGCSQVQPWERGYLAKQEMAWDSDPLERALNDHFFSKEASSGGNIAAGGSCGCN